MDVLEAVLNAVREIAPRLPTGLRDPQALTKYADEDLELHVSLGRLDYVGALTEVADCGYYVGKAWWNNLITDSEAMRMLQGICAAFVLHNLTPPRLSDIPILIRAKYESRIQNGKTGNDQAERDACAAALRGEERHDRP